MQRGHITKHHGSWLLRFYDTVLKEGRPVKKLRAVKLARIDEQFPTKRSVLLLAEKVLAPINTGAQVPASAASVRDFIEYEYLPHVKKHLRKSTYVGYHHIFRTHLKHRLNCIMRDFRTVTAQRLLTSIYEDAKGELSHASMKHIKSMLSGVFTHALRTGVVDGVNVVSPCAIPGRVERKKQEIYTLDEVQGIIACLATPEEAKKSPARLIIAVLGFSGLRISEVRGLRWSDYDGENIYVRRSVWATSVNPPKTTESGSAVPALKMVKLALETRRREVKPEDVKSDGFIFAGPEGFALNMLNLSRRIIRPAMDRAREKDSTFPTWRGYHAFRRGLGTILHQTGASPKTIQQILRHSDVSDVTMNRYVLPDDSDSRKALAKVEASLKILGTGRA